MEIKRLIPYSLVADLEEKFAFSQFWYSKRKIMLLKVITDEGIIGWGEALGPPRANKALIEEVFEPIVLGCDPFDNKKIWQEVYNKTRGYGQKGLVLNALSALDLALWDIKGKATQLPVNKILGGCFREKIKAYATGLYFLDESNLEKILAEEAREYLKQGFRAIKMKVGYGLEKDVELVSAVRKAIGPDVRLMVDANGAYSPAMAGKIAKNLKEFDIFWFEEPIPPEEIKGYKKIKDKFPMFISAGEANYTRWGVRELITTQSLDIVQPDVAISGGLTEARRISDLAETWNIFCMPHAWGTPISLAASLHLISSMGHIPPSLNPLEPMLEFDKTENPLRSVIKHDIELDENGYVKVPEQSGLGIDVDEKLMEKYVY